MKLIRILILILSLSAVAPRAFAPPVNGLPLNRGWLQSPIDGNQKSFTNLAALSVGAITNTTILTTNLTATNVNLGGGRIVLDGAGGQISGVTYQGHLGNLTNGVSYDQTLVNPYFNGIATNFTAFDLFVAGWRIYSGEDGSLRIMDFTSFTDYISFSEEKFNVVGGATFAGEVIGNLGFQALEGGFIGSAQYLTNFTAADFHGTNTFALNSDIAFTRKTVTTLGNGVNVGVPIGTNVFVEISGNTAAATISGLDAGGAQRDGAFRILLYRQPYTLTFSHQNVIDPVPANRIVSLTGLDRVSAGPCAAMFLYNAAASRWILVGFESLTSVGITNVLLSEIQTNTFLTGNVLTYDGQFWNGAGTVGARLAGFTNTTRAFFTNDLGYTKISGDGIVSTNRSTGSFATVTNGGFSGDGAGLTALNASQLTSGTVASARLPQVPIAKIDASGTPTSATFLRGDGAWGNVPHPWSEAGGVLTPTADRVRLDKDGESKQFETDAIHDLDGTRTVSLASGLVGIGTSAPEQRLHIAADASYGSYGDFGQFIVTGETDTNIRMVFGVDTDDEFVWMYAAHVGVAALPLLLNPYYGHVGIGAGGTAPTAKLHIGQFTSGGAAGNAPLKFDSASLMATPEAGAFEYTGSSLTFTYSDTRRDKILTAQTRSTVSLTADNQVVTATGKAYLGLSSDNGTAGNRTFVLTAGTVDQVLRLEWVGTNAGELVDDAANSGSGNVRLSATWTPTQYDVLTLVFNGTDWLEVSRSAN